MIFTRLSIGLCTVAALVAVSGGAAVADEGPVYELRIYTARPGKLDALTARFRDHTDGLFKKNGLEAVGYWIPVDSPLADNTFVYILKHPDRATAKKSWLKFLGDPEWKAAAAESRKDGPLITKVESTYMRLTDYSPQITAGESQPGKERIFELRMYTAPEGKLADLHARFRNHTDTIFRKHGLNALAYWAPTDEPKSKNTLIYMLSMESRDAAKKSWRAFLADPEWKAAFAESEKNGPLLTGPPKSIFMKPTDFSPIR